MKKLLLSIIGATALSATASSFVNIKNATSIVNSDDKTQENWKWENINIKHSKETKSWIWEEETVGTLSATNVSWGNIFLKSKELIVTGYFALHTYKNPKYLDDMILKLDETNSKPNYRIWVGEESNDQWSGWDHQTAKIKLTVIAKYNEETKLVDLFINSYIYVWTTDYKNACSITSQINSVRFIDTIQKNNADLKILNTEEYFFN